MTVNILNGPPETVEASTLIPHPQNPRRGDLDAIRASIRYHGFYGTIVAQKSSRHILAGNHRYQAALLEGFTDLPVVWVDVDDETALRILLTDNRTSDLGTYDEKALTDLLLHLDADGGFDGSGYTDADLQQLLASLGTASQDDGPSEPPAEPVTQPGDLWVLGRHRLVCGDATDREAVAFCLDGATPNLMVTDPPYGVEYDAMWREVISHADGRRGGKVSNDDRADWREAWALFPGDVAYVWHAGRHASEVQSSLEAVSLEVRSQLIWAKQHFPMSRGHYHWRHEPCWYAVRKGADAAWIGNRKQTTVWDDITLDENVEGGHSTQKPAECMARPIRNHQGDIYDPFIGSGTTLIAAENLNRTCYALEINPAYSDVTVHRWETHTRQQAEHIRP